MNIQINKPALFTKKQIAIEGLMALLPQAIFGYSIAFGLSAFAADLFFLLRFGMSPFGVFIPLCALITGLALLFYAPSMLMMNMYIKHIVKSADLLRNNTNEYICQLSLKPRLSRGLWGFLEDADDIGVLRIAEDDVLFAGDHINLSIPFAAIESVGKHNIGWRGFWLSGKRIRLTLKDVTAHSQVEFCERQSTTLIEANKTSESVFTLLAERVRKRQPEVC